MNGTPRERRLFLTFPWRIYWEDNPNTVNLALRMGARIYKRYRKYQFHIPDGRGDDTDIR